MQYTPHLFSHGLATSVVGLRLTISPDHFVDDGSMKVRCVATVAPLLWQGDRESVLQKIDKREALLLGKFKHGQSQYSGHITRIEGENRILITDKHDEEQPRKERGMKMAAQALNYYFWKASRLYYKYLFIFGE